MPCGTQGPSRPLIQGVSGGLVKDQCGLGDINIAFLDHSILVALVDRPPSRLAGIVMVNHSHQQVPKRRSVLPLGARARTLESTIARAAYLDGTCKSQFCLYSNANPLTLPSPDQDWYRISVVSAT